MKFDPKTAAVHLLPHKSMKAVLYFFTILACFLAVYFTAQAGIEKYPSLYSIDAKVESGVEMDASSEIKIVFNQPVIFLEKKNIEIIPALEFDFALSESGKEVTLKHEKPFLPETKYEIDLMGVRGLSGLTMDDKRFFFITRAGENENIDLEFISDEATFSQFELSENRYIPPESSRPKIDLEIEPKFIEGKYIDISISNQIMTLFEDGVRVNSFLISSGKRGFPTPSGTFSVKRKEDNHWSSSYGLWMPYSMNFSGSFYIHELPYWPSGYREGENHLGVRVSHGCVRLGIGPAKYVYDWAEIGTPIYIHN